MVFTQVAVDLYWQHYQPLGRLTWESFKQALRDRFKGQHSGYGLRDEIRKRLQQPGEGFNCFSEAADKIMERLENPLSEMELVESLRRGLHPSTQKSILHFPATTVYQLRQLG